jgi:hypothetical protein
MKVRKWDGRPISQPGWVSGIPIEKYHSAGICDGPAVSSSDLRTCWSKSPAHMFSRWAENPDREEPKVSDAMKLGACAHYLLLGEENFRTKYVAEPETYRDVKTAEVKKWSNIANACKAWHEQQRLEGRLVMKVSALEDIIAMSRSLALEPLVKDGLLSGHIETSGFFKDKETNLWVKVRPDVVPTAGPDYVDLKTAREVTTVSLMSSIREHGYHQQGGLIWEACEALGQPFETFVLLFIETSNPYCARTVPLTDDDLARGRLQNRAMMRKIKGCMDVSHWPGPGEGDLRPLPLSVDERDRIDARLKAEGLA